MNSSKSAAILVAAGQGERLAGFSDGKPKQFSELGGVPLFVWSLATFAVHPAVEQIVLSIPEGWQSETLDWINQYLPQLIHKITIVIGGTARQESVCLALEALAKADNIPEYVFIHDAARPFVAADTIDQILKKLKQGHAVTLAVPISDSVKGVSEGIIVEDLDRNKLVFVQTPQAAQFHIVLAAHRSARLKQQIATDDAAIIKSHGVDVITIPGSRLNLKITEPEDLVIANALIKNHNWHPGQIILLPQEKLVSNLPLLNIGN